MTGNAYFALIAGVLTASTALAASWVTSKGNLEATRVKAQAEAAEVRLERLRDSRRASYANFLGNVNTMKWQLIDAMNFAIDGDDTAASGIMTTRNTMVGEMNRCRTAVLLDGPRTLEEATKALGDAAVELMLALEKGIAASQPARLVRRLAPSMARLNQAVERFTHEAQAVLGSA